MFWQTLWIFIFPVYTYYITSTWQLLDKLPPGVIEDGEMIQAVYVFKFPRYYWYDSCNFKIDVTLKYIIYPPSDIYDFCQMSSETHHDELKCRRRKQFLHSETWIQQTLGEYIYRAYLSDRLRSALYCIISRLPPIKFPTSSTTTATTTTTTTTTTTITTAATTATTTLTTTAKFTTVTEGTLATNEDKFIGVYDDYKEEKKVVARPRHERSICLRTDGERPNHPATSSQAKNREDKNGMQIMTATTKEAATDLWNNPEKMGTTAAMSSNSKEAIRFK
ncbi:unnamed protein product [Cylicocyclus nassatus]|uniref:Uncharacterized protein n=1 Tax=Cylicocyclus nassatus TaxID=53992 RepID=A0AA36M648_CYLNA|nr:unnamed protein product [Cylicocyclus nassatus]